MRMTSRAAALGLIFAHAPVLAASGGAPAVPESISPESQFDLGGSTSPTSFGLGVRRFSPFRLAGAPDRRRDGERSRALALGPAPDADHLLSFARSGVETPNAALSLRDAPRFSRLPGKQLQDYEMGLHAALADGAVALQAGLFYDKFRAVQTTMRQGGIQTTGTVGKAKVYGLEGFARWSASDRFSLFASYAVREGRLKNHFRDGRRFRLSADHSAAAGAVLLLPAGPGRFAFTPSVARQSAMGIGMGQGRDGDEPGAIMLVNAQLGYAFPQGFEVEALATNLLDRQYDRPSARPGSPMLIAGEPRVIGLRARLRLRS